MVSWISANVLWHSSPLWSELLLHLSHDVLWHTVTPILCCRKGCLSLRQEGGLFNDRSQEVLQHYISCNIMWPSINYIQLSLMKENEMCLYENAEIFHSGLRGKKKKTFFDIPKHFKQFLKMFWYLVCSWNKTNKNIGA